MKTVLIKLEHGFEEIEKITVVDILRRAGSIVTISTTVLGVIECSRGIKLTPDEILEVIMNNEFDLICLAGGKPSTNNLKKWPENSQTFTENAKSREIYIRIFALPTILKKAGIVKNRSITCHPSVKPKFYANIDDRVVIEWKLITSQSPGTAMELALKLVEIHFGVDRMKNVNAGVLARIWAFKN